METKRVLVVEHEEMCPPGWMGSWLSEAGLELDVRRPYAGTGLPDTLEEHDALVVLGGSMNAYADESCPWLPGVRALVREAAEDGVPTLGICLGHQLVTVALGGEVAVNPAGQQIGVLEVGWLPAALDDPLFSPLAGPQVAVQWNNDIAVRLPDTAVALARTPRGEVQAARFAPTVWGVQWHPEANGDVVRHWADADRDEAKERGVDVDSYVEDVRAAHDRLRAAWQPLAERFARLVRAPGAGA